MITLLGDAAAKPATARFLLAIKLSFLLPWKKIAFAGRGQEGFEPVKAPLSLSSSDWLASQTNDHVDAAYFIPRRKIRHPRGRDQRVGDINQFVALLEVEMAVLGYVGIEIGLCPVDADPTQETELGELIQGVVDSRKRNADLGRNGYLEDHFCREMPMFATEQEAAKSDTLARRPKANRLQQVHDV
jgi:hypothetical protein